MVHHRWKSRGHDMRTVAIAERYLAFHSEEAQTIVNNRELWGAAPCATSWLSDSSRLRLSRRRSGIIRTWNREETSTFFLVRNAGYWRLCVLAKMQKAVQFNGGYSL